MRALVAFLLMSLALSGCIGGNGSDPDDFERSCPSWTAFTTTGEEGQSIRPAAHKATISHYWNNTSGPNGGGAWPDEHDESPPIVPGSPGGIRLNGETPVDFYELTFEYFITVDVDTQLRAQTDSGRALLFRNINPGPGENEFTSILRFPAGTNLTADEIPTYRLYLANADADPAPSGIVLVWDHAPNKDKDAQTHSFSFTKFDVHAWFRQC